MVSPFIMYVSTESTPHKPPTTHRIYRRDIWGGYLMLVFHSPIAGSDDPVFTLLYCYVYGNGSQSEKLPLFVLSLSSEGTVCVRRRSSLLLVMLLFSLL